MTTCIGMQPSRSAIARVGAVVRSPAKACLGFLVAVVLLPFATGTALALSCVGPERLLFPPPGDIPPNPVFVLQLDGATGDPIRGLPVVSSDISFTGGHSRARILERSDAIPGYITFAPVRPLREGPMDLRLRRSFEGRPAEWTSLGTFKVHGPPDETVPTLQQQAHRATTRVQEPASWGAGITVELPVTADESPVLWLATIDASEEGQSAGSAGHDVPFCRQADFEHRALRWKLPSRARQAVPRRPHSHRRRRSSRQGHRPVHPGRDPLALREPTPRR